MKYAEIKKFDVANGPGVRISLFVSGCSHYCKGCFNSIAWDYDYGKPFTDETIKEIIEFMDNPMISGLTLLGGEPMDPRNQEALVPLVEKVKEKYPDKTIWCFTGYLFDDDIMEKFYYTIPATKRLLACFDVMVDGEFDMDLADITLVFKGSSNQRTIMVQESLKSGEIVLWDNNTSMRAN